MDRQRQALESKGCDIAVASSSKVVLIESNIDEYGLGVAPPLDREVRVLRPQST